MSYSMPYAGLRVVDLSQGVAGPYCAMLLAQYGAEVIKVEPPEGDWSRILGSPIGDHTAYSIAANLGKRSVVLDLKRDTDRTRLWRLIERADVFLEGFRPGVIERLGFDYPRVSQRNKRLLYVSISGFGQVGPLAAKPAMDPVLQAFTGFMMANTDANGKPQRAGPIVVDMATALYAYQAVASALFARERLDEGRKIEVSLMQAAANLQVIRMMQAHLLGHQPRAGTAPSGVFACSDGYIQIVVLKQKDFVEVCRILDLPALASDPRFANQAGRMEHATEIGERVAERLAGERATHWCERFTEAGIQNERVLDYPEFLAHPQVAANAVVSWLQQPGLDRPVPVTNPPGLPVLQSGTRLAHAPLKGEHSDEILREIEERT